VNRKPQTTSVQRTV